MLVTLYRECISQFSRETEPIGERERERERERKRREEKRREYVIETGALHGYKG